MSLELCKSCTATRQLCLQSLLVLSQQMIRTKVAGEDVVLYVRASSSF
jgi:hypothetical protein